MWQNNVSKNNLLQITEFSVNPYKEKDKTCNLLTRTFIILIASYAQTSNLFQNGNKSFYLKTFMHATKPKIVFLSGTKPSILC